MAAPFIPLAPDTFSGRKLGKYEIVCRLSTGGMAEIFLAFQKGLGGFRKYCVLKLILPDIKGEEEFVRMFLDEAKITAAFNHPNIAHVYDLDVADGELFLAMEFVPGATLVEVARMCRINSEPIPVGMTLQAVRDTALALHYAHNFTDSLGNPQPVIHRDIAEKNIMVTYEGSTKLLDFGIAKNTAAISRTMVGMVKGTTGYMSPEQILGEVLDGRSDQFSLGVVLHECLTGMRLFHAKNPEQGMMAPLKENVAPPSRQNPQVTPQIDAVVLKSLRRQREERYPTLLDFARDLERAAGPAMWRPEQTAPFIQRLFSERREQTRQLLNAVSQHASEVTSELKLNQLLKADARPLRSVPPTPPPLPPPVPAETTEPGRVAVLPPKRPTEDRLPPAPKKPTGRATTGETTKPYDSQTPPRRRDHEHTDPLGTRNLQPETGETTVSADDDEPPEMVTVLNRPVDRSILEPPPKPRGQVEVRAPEPERTASLHGSRTWAPPPVPDEVPPFTPWDAEVTGAGDEEDDEDQATQLALPTRPPSVVTADYPAEPPEDSLVEPTGEHDTVSNIAPAGSKKRRSLGGVFAALVLAAGAGAVYFSGLYRLVLPREEMTAVAQPAPEVQLPPAKDEQPQVAPTQELAKVDPPVAMDAGGGAVAVGPVEPPKVEEKQTPPPVEPPQQVAAVIPAKSEAKKAPAQKKPVREKKVEAEEKSDAQGQLTLVTTPWAKVQFKAQDLGATPLFKVALPVGKHTLKLTGPDNQTVLLPVEIKEGEVTTVRQKLADLSAQ